VNALFRISVDYQPCIPTRRAEVPAGPDWFHEIKHDGYRLIVQREGKRVRLLTRRGYDWSDRYPLIVEAALRLRKTSFVIDGDAVVVRRDGISDFDVCTAGTGTPSGSISPMKAWTCATRPCKSASYGWASS